MCVRVRACVCVRCWSRTPIWWLRAPPSATRRSLDEADLNLIKKGIENTGIKSYNNDLSLLVGNRTRIQVIQSTPDSRLVMRFTGRQTSFQKTRSMDSRLVMRFTVSRPAVSKPEAFYIKKQQYSYSYFGAEMGSLFPSPFTPKRMRESVGRSCVSCSHPPGVFTGRVQYSESEF